MVLTLSQKMLCETGIVEKAQANVPAVIFLDPQIGEIKIQKQHKC